MGKELLYDKKRTNILFLMLLILPINDIIASIISPLNISVSKITILLYFIVFVMGIITIIKCPIYKSNILSLIIIYLFYVLMYFISSDYGKKEFLTTNMNIIYFYYIPLSILFVSNIKSWKLLFSERSYIIISDIIILLAFFSRFSNNVVDYMVFSYNILPLCGIIMVSMIQFENKRQILFLTLSIIELTLFGSRGALIWLLICGILLYISTFIKSFENKKTFYKKIFSIVLVFIVSLFCIMYIIPKILESSFGNTSYILRRIKAGSIVESDARLAIYKTSIEHIKQNGININGLFYDRTILPKNTYAHNFILELYLSFGLLLGSVFLIIFARIIFKVIKRCYNMYLYVAIYFITIFFLRYFLSGSIFSEGKFIIFFAFLFSIINNKQLCKKD